MKVLVTGSRTWTDYGLIYERFSRLPVGTTIMHGGARGADRLADRAGKELGLDVLPPFRPDWNPNGVYNPRAGFERNHEMLDERPDLVLAFRDLASKSPGTTHCVNAARKRGIPVELVGEPVQLQMEVV